MSKRSASGRHVFIRYILYARFKTYYYCYTIEYIIKKNAIKLAA